MNNTTGFVIIISLMITCLVAIASVLIIVSSDSHEVENTVRDRMLQSRKQYYLLNHTESNLTPKPKFIGGTIKPSPSHSPIPWTPPLEDDMITTEAAIAYTLLPVTTTRRLKFPQNMPDGNLKIQAEAKVAAKTELPPIQLGNRETLLQLIHELKPPHDDKISTILVHNGLLYLGMTHGKFIAYNTSSYEVVLSFKTAVAIQNMAFLEDGTLAITEMRKNRIVLFDENFQVANELRLEYDTKDMTVYKNEIYVLSRSYEDIYVYDTNLVLVKTIEFDNSQQETCNFIIPTENVVYVSCQSAIVTISKDDTTIIQRFAEKNASYSLAIGLLANTLLAVQRGQSEIHAFDLQSGALQTKFVSSYRAPALWSSIALKDDKLFALEYVSNTVKVFALP